MSQDKNLYNLLASCYYSSMKYSQVVLICSICAKDFSVFAYRSRTAKFCGQKCYGNSRIGLPAPNKGKTLEAVRGENHWNWKKDRTQVKRQDRHDNPLYKQWRKAVFEKDDFRCMDCGERKGKIEADHIYPWAKFPRLRYFVENGQTLCKPCHKTKTHNTLITTR